MLKPPYSHLKHGDIADIGVFSGTGVQCSVDDNTHPSSLIASS
jgi:hypothetical protein